MLLPEVTIQRVQLGQSEILNRVKSGNGVASGTRNIRRKVTMNCKE